MFTQEELMSDFGFIYSIYSFLRPFLSILNESILLFSFCEMLMWFLLVKFSWYNIIWNCPILKSIVFMCILDSSFLSNMELDNFLIHLFISLLRKKLVELGVTLLYVFLHSDELRNDIIITKPVSICLPTALFNWVYMLHWA